MSKVPPDANRDDYDRRVNHWIQKKWLGHTDCPICRENRWQVGEAGQVSVIDAIGRRRYPIVPLICENCGYMILINALISGIMEPNVPAEANDEPVSAPDPD